MQAWIDGVRLIPEQKRRAVRRLARPRCQVVAEEGFRWVSERALDLSLQGMLVRTRAEVAVGEPLFVALQPPGATTWVDAQAIVARIVRGARAADDGRALALEFQDLDPVARALLAGALYGMPPPVPRRRIRRNYARTIARIAAG